MSRIAQRLYDSGSIDLIGGRNRMLRLPDRREARRTVLMPENPTAVLCAECVKAGRGKGGCISRFY